MATLSTSAPRKGSLIVKNPVPVDRDPSSGYTRGGHEFMIVLINSWPRSEPNGITSLRPLKERNFTSATNPPILRGPSYGGPWLGQRNATSHFRHNLVSLARLGLRHVIQRSSSAAAIHSLIM